MRVYLKMAIRRDGKRPEPYYWLTEVCEEQGNVGEALHYYCRAIDAGRTFQRAAARHLGALEAVRYGNKHVKFWIIARRQKNAGHGSHSWPFIQVELAVPHPLADSYVIELSAMQASRTCCLHQIRIERG